MSVQFQRATKRAAKLRLSIAGPSGAGKTYTALTLATALVPGGRVAVIDTEHGSASKYADLFEFDVLELAAPFHPDRFTEAIGAAASAGYDVAVVDSLSHAWNGSGGLLEIVDQIAARMKTSNTFAAWKDATPIHNRLVESMIAAPLHIVATMRSKQEYVIEEDNRGRKSPRKLGMAPVQRDGMEYEFDLFAEMDMQNRMLVQKSRCPELQGQVIEKPTGAVSDTLRAWLAGEPERDGPANGNGSANGTAKAAATVSVHTLSELENAGGEGYGKDWPAKREQLTRAVTKGRTGDSALLTEAEAQTLIAGIHAAAEKAANAEAG